MFSSFYLFSQNCVDFSEIDDELNQIEDICNCDVTLELGTTGQTTYISQYQFNHVFIADECIKVYGSLVIDEPKIFARCDFIMEEESEIVIAYRQTGISGSSFQSCGSTMWKGIKIEEGNEIVFRNNIIRDAYIGINTYPFGKRATATVTGNIFHNNWTAINIGDQNDYNKRSKLVLRGNIFSTTQPLKDHWIYPSFLDDDFAIGVQAINAIVDADASNDPCNDRNVFMRLRTGYLLTDCESVINSNFFYDFNVTIDPGYGISAQSSSQKRSSLEVNGGYKYFTKTGDGINFKDVPQPIYTTWTENVISGNQIEGAERAITVFNALVRNQVSLNSIEAKEVGIEIIDNMSPTMGVSYNDITIKADNEGYIGRGIEVFASGISAKKGSIHCNMIDLEPGRFGILLNNAEGKDLRENFVGLSGEPTGNVSGIEIRGGELNAVRHGKIYGAPNPGTFVGSEVNGLKIAGSAMNFLTGIETDDMEYGFHFSGSSFSTRQDQNEFYSHRVGYYLDESAQIGNQRNNGNQWLGTYGDFGAQLAEPANIQGNRHQVFKNLENTTYDPQSIDPAFGWFRFRPFGTHDPLPPIHCLTAVNHLDIVFTEADSLIAIDSLNPTPFTERRKWEAARYLYKKIIKNPSSETQLYPYVDFVDSVINTEIHDYYALNYALDSLTTFPQQVIEDIKEQDSLYQIMREEAHYWIGLWDSDPDSLHYLDSASHYFNEMDDIWSLTNVWYQDWWDGVENGLASLQTMVSALSSPNTYAANEKLVLEGVVISLTHPDSISGSHLNDLRELSEKCVLEHGPAVYQAGALMKYFGEDRITEQVYCEDNSQNRVIQPLSKEEKGWELYPNPTMDEINVRFLNEKGMSGSIKIVSMEGRLMKMREIEDHFGALSLDVSHLPSGVYMVHWTDGESVQVDKVVIKR